MTEGSQGQHQFRAASAFLETGGWSVESCGASFEGSRGPESEAWCQEADVGIMPSEPIRHPVNMARKSRSTSKVNSKWVLGGVRRHKKGRARTQRGNQHPDGSLSADSGEPLHLLF